MSAQEYDDYVRLFANRDEMAERYADLMPEVGLEWNWSPLNQAILRRWSPSGLQYIKAKAWKMRLAARSPSRTERGQS